jgi:outer membrane protein assembly factor BamB
VISVRELGDLVVVTTSLGQVVAYSLEGVRRWELALRDIAISSPTRDGDVVVVHDLSGQLTALDSRTGAVKWRSRTTAEAAAAPAAATGLVIAVDRGGSRVAFDGRDGRVVWSTQGQPAVALAADTRQVVIADDAGNVTSYAFDGTQRWTAEADTDGAHLEFVGDSPVMIGERHVTVFDAEGHIQRILPVEVDAATMEKYVVVLGAGSVCAYSISGSASSCHTIQRLGKAGPSTISAGRTGVWIPDGEGSFLHLGGAALGQGS